MNKNNEPFHGLAFRKGGHKVQGARPGPVPLPLPLRQFAFCRYVTAELFGLIDCTSPRSGRLVS